MALEERLRHEHLGTGVPLTRLRKIVAFDRLLARLAVGSHGNWVLKGGFALQVMLPDRARTTKDVDLHAVQPGGQATQIFFDASALDLGDYFSFVVSSGTLAEGGTMRFGVECRIDGRSFETFHVDVGADEPMVGEPQSRRITSLLAFAGLPPVVFPCCPLGQHLAEKVHALTRPRGERDNSRSKDIVDIVLLAETAAIDAAELREALEATFAACGTHPLPQSLSTTPRTWASEYHRSARDLGMRSETLEDGQSVASALMDPVLHGMRNGRWNPNSLQWEDSHD